MSSRRSSRAIAKVCTAWPSGRISCRLSVAAGGNGAAWAAFLREHERLEMQATDLYAFIGCHAAADAANKLYRQVRSDAVGARSLARTDLDKSRIRSARRQRRRFQCARRRRPVLERQRILSRTAPEERAAQAAAGRGIAGGRPGGRRDPRLGPVVRPLVGRAADQGHGKRGSRREVAGADPVRLARAIGPAEQFLRGRQSLEVDRRQLCRFAQSYCRHAADDVPAAGAGRPSGNAAAQEPNETGHAGYDVVGHHAAQGNLAQVSGRQGATAGAGAAGVVRHAGAAARHGGAGSVGGDPVRRGGRPGRAHVFGLQQRFGRVRPDGAHATAGSRPRIARANGKGPSAPGSPPRNSRECS